MISVAPQDSKDHLERRLHHPLPIHYRCMPIYHSHHHHHQQQQQHHQQQQQQHQQHAQEYRAMPHRIYPPSAASEATGYHTGYLSPVSLPTASPRPIHSSNSNNTPQRFALSHQEEAPISQALEVARESPDGAQDPTVCKILEGAISAIWARILAEPGSYVMSRGEFAVFNYFQHRFVENKAATAARARYWDNAYA